MAKFKDTKMCPKCCAIFFLNECPVCALEKRIDAHDLATKQQAEQMRLIELRQAQICSRLDALDELVDKHATLIELIRTPIWTATPHKDFESLDEFLAESDEDLPNHMTRCSHGNAVSETVVCEACDSDEEEVFRCPEGPHTGDQCGSIPVSPDEEWKAVWIEQEVALGSSQNVDPDGAGQCETALAKLVVQERASRESWAERARLMEDERNKERKRAEDAECERDSARAYGRDLMAQRNRCMDAFEELVGECRKPQEIGIPTVDKDLLDALEKKARGE